MSNVFISSLENRERFKDAIIAYLNGTYDINETRHNIRLACKYQTVEIDAKSFAKTIPLYSKNTDKELDPQIVEILRHLKMDTKKSTYTNAGITSLYDLLRTQKERDVDYLMDDLIDDLQPSVPWFNYVYKPALFAIGILSFSYIQPEYFWMAIDWVMDIIPVVYHWLYHYVVQLNNWPVIGMGMQFAWLTYFVRSTFQHGLEPSQDKLRTLLFRTIALTLNFLGHMLSYGTAGTLTWAPALFFIGSSLVSIIESIYFYATQKSPDLNGTDVHTKAWQMRHTYKLERNFNYFVVRIIHAITISSLLIACTVLPSSLILTMTYTLSLSLATLIKDYCIGIIKHRSASAEQLAVLGIYNSPEFNPERKITNDKNMFQAEAGKIIDTFSDNPVKQNALRLKMVEQLDCNSFSFDRSIEIFKNCADFYDYCSPSPQPSTPAYTNRFKFGGTPSRSAIRNLGPLTQEKEDSSSYNGNTPTPSIHSNI